MLDLSLEKKFWDKDGTLPKTVVGIDEVGRGCWAGPLLMCGVSVNLATHRPIPNVNDSKQLTSKQREVIYENAKLAADNSELIIKFSWQQVETIDKVGLAQSLKLALTEIIESFPVDSSFLADGGLKPELKCDFHSYIKGDAQVYSIALASICAKCERDQYMREIELQYPGYDFAHNVGYGTASHQKALAELGVTKIHRHSFAPIKELVKKLLLD